MANKKNTKPVWVNAYAYVGTYRAWLEGGTTTHEYLPLVSIKTIAHKAQRVVKEMQKRYENEIVANPYNPDITHCTLEIMVESKREETPRKMAIYTAKSEAEEFGIPYKPKRLSKKLAKAERNKWRRLNAPVSKVTTTISDDDLPF